MVWTIFFLNLLLSFYFTRLIPEKIFPLPITDTPNLKPLNVILSYYKVSNNICNTIFDNFHLKRSHHN